MSPGPCLQTGGRECIQTGLYDGETELIGQYIDRSPQRRQRLRKHGYPERPVRLCGRGFRARDVEPSQDPNGGATVGESMGRSAEIV